MKATSASFISNVSAEEEDGNTFVGLPPPTEEMDKALAEFLKDVGKAPLESSHQPANLRGRHHKRLSFSDIIEVDEESMLSSRAHHEEQLIEEVVIGEQTNTGTVANRTNTTHGSDPVEPSPSSLLIHDRLAQHHSEQLTCGNYQQEGWERMERRALNEQWKLLKSYESFIVEMVFEMGIMDRLYDLRTFLELASQNYRRIKQTRKTELEEHPPNTDRIQSSRQKQNILVEQCSKACGSKKKSPERKKSSSPNRRSKGSSIMKNNRPIGGNSNSPDRKKVTIVLPQSQAQLAELKHKLTDHISQHIKLLTVGKTFRKWCLNSNKIESVHAYFSMDLKYFAWRSSDSDKQPRMQPMSEFVEIRLGKVSKNFRKYLKRGEDPQDGRSFSLVFNKRTIDLTAASEQDCQEFVRAISELRKFM